MNKEDKTGSKFFNQIENYIEGRLNDQETEAFEKELEDNEELSKAIDEYFVRHNPFGELTMDTLGDNYWRNVLKDASNKNEPTSFYSQYKVLFFIAASFIGLLSICYYFFQYRVLSNDDLFAQYFQMPPIESLTVIGEDRNNTEEEPPLSSEVRKWDAALEAYSNNKFYNSLKILESIDSSKLQRNTYSEYLCIKGILYLKNEEYQKAFDLLTRDETANPKQKRWYTALAMLKLNYSEPELIEVFSSLEHDSNKRAKSILKKLKND